MEIQDTYQDDPNPPYGQKGAFRKLTMTVPPQTYQRLLLESIRRKINHEPNHLMSALVREALDEYFTIGDLDAPDRGTVELR
ncbi:MAG: hypothetical protein C5B51_02075 [Terriglobia bacterium]|nr:MAG: hypothetical protein C5B51_02075 [Terriglobia bacterium]